MHLSFSVVALCVCVGGKESLGDLELCQLTLSYCGTFPSHWGFPNRRPDLATPVILVCLSNLK